MGIAEDLTKISSYNPHYGNVSMSITDRIDHNKNVRPNGHLMKIEGFTKLYTNQVKMVESSVFEVCGIKWKLKLYPSGKSNSEDYVSLYLDMEDENKDANVSLRFFALDLFDKLWFKTDLKAYFNSRNTSFGVQSFRTHDTLSKAVNGYIRSDAAVFGVEIMKNQYNILRSLGTADCVKIIEKPKDNKFTWKITKFSSFDQTDHFSHAFTVGERQWRIKIYPRGEDQNGNGGLSVYLVPFEHLNNDLKATNYAKYKLRVLDQRYGNHRVASCEYWFFRPRLGYGRKNLITRSELDDESGFLRSDTIYIGVEFELITYTQRC